MGFGTLIEKTALNKCGCYEGAQILSGARLHASWYFFGEKLEKKFRHRRVTRC